VNKCDLVVAMTGPRLERGARRCMSACHEQLDVWLRHTAVYTSWPANWSSTSRLYLMADG